LGTYINIIIYAEMIITNAIRRNNYSLDVKKGTSCYKWNVGLLRQEQERFTQKKYVT